MMRLNNNDTIAAVSTAVGESGIGIVRISGQRAIEIAADVFRGADGSCALDFKSYTVHYGRIIDGKKTLDEVILTVMRAPRSYTREDIIEINCHGGPVALRGVLELVLLRGARMAEPGEFTRRAFLNGRIDLAQAEAVLDVIRAKTDSALRAGLGQLDGALSKHVSGIRKRLLGILSGLEANIDFPEDEVSAADLQAAMRALKEVDIDLKRDLDNSDYGRILREGVTIAICGKPNVGKSSLLNAILRQERSIVTPVAGTTRDTVEESVNINGVSARIIDTAGLIKPRDIVERKAIHRSKRYMAKADLLLMVFDASKPLGAQDMALIKKADKKRTIAVINKIDLKNKINKDRLRGSFREVVGVSAKKNRNIRDLEERISAAFREGKVDAAEPVLVTNLRHIEKIARCEKFVAHALDSLDNGLSIEYIAQDLKDAMSYLDEITGRSSGEDLLDKIFREFCIGK